MGMMMSNIQRLRQGQVQNGQLVNADDLNAEIDQLLNQSNTHDDLLLQNGTLTGNKVFANSVTVNQNLTVQQTAQFNQTVKANTLIETTANSGVTVEGVRMRDGMIAPIAPTVLAQPPVDGELWYQPSTQGFYYAQQGTKIIRSYSPSYVGGKAPKWLDNNRVQLPAGLEAMATDSNGNPAMIRVPSASIELNLNTVGLLGLDNGTRANDTFYYVWLLADANMNVSAVYSTSPTALSTNIASSWVYRRRLPVVCKTYPTSITLGSGTTTYAKAGALVKFIILYWGATVHQQYIVTSSSNVLYADPTTGWIIGETNVLFDGAGGFDVSNPYGMPINTTKWLPPIEVLALQFAWSIRSAVGEFRLSDSAGNRFCGIGSSGMGLTPMMPLDTSRTMNYYRMGGAGSLLNLDVIGFILAP
jgi:hypothetical protein